MKQRVFVIVAAALLFGLAASKHSVTSYKDRRGWNVYGGGTDNIHYSTLKQIDKKNVSRLQVAWTFDSGDAFTQSEMECNPIVVNGVLFATTPKLRVIALDAATGMLKWAVDPNQGHRVIGMVTELGVTYRD